MSTDTDTPPSGAHQPSNDVELGVVHFRFGDDEDHEIRRLTEPAPLPVSLPASSTTSGSSSPIPSSDSALSSARSMSPAIPSTMPAIPPPGKIRRNSSLSSPPVQVIFEDVNFVVKISAKEASSLAHKLGDAFVLPTDPKAMVDRTILKKLSGVLQPGRLTAIMGPSGSGKTTLLNTIAGYVNVPKGAKLSGAVKLNGHSFSLDERRTQLYVRSLSGYVHQHDVILSTMTVREAITMSALLRLPNGMEENLKKQRIEEVIDLLGLGKCADNFIGSATLKGISGGERRRVSIGMELITNPSILFLDEPTSGLDTFTAYSVTNTLRTLAQQHQRTIVATIHQPNSDIFHLFDDLILLADGQVMYAGPAMGSLPYFSKYGFHCPEYSNPADWLFMKILYSFQEHGSEEKDAELLEDDEDDEVFEVEDEDKKADDEKKSPSSSLKKGETAPLTAARRPSKLADLSKRQNLLSAWPTSSECGVDADTRKSPLNERLPHQPEDIRKLDKAGFAVQFQVLLRRALFNYLRNKLAIGAQLGQSIFFGLLAGLVWFQVNSDQKGIQDRNGALFFLCSGMLFGASMGILNIFSEEKHIFAREYAAGMYSLPAYYFSRLVVELPARTAQPLIMAGICYFLVGFQAIFVHFVRFVISMALLQYAGMSIGMLIASLTPSIQVALPIMQTIFLPLMIFSGYFLNEHNSPVYLGWLTYFSPIKYTFVALTKIEYFGLLLHCSSGQYVASTSANGNTSLFCPYTQGEQVITYLDFDNELTIGENQYVMLGFSVGLAALAYVGLFRTARKI